MNSFEKTLDFNERLKHPAHKLIAKAFGTGFKSRTKVVSLNDLALDQRASIDAKIDFTPSLVSFSIQEKYRTNDKLKFLDFTQELYNAYGTEHQTDGEFKHLYSDYYFYGWSNETETDFAQWFIMDIKTYKTLVLGVGGLDKIPQVKRVQNNAYGKALFYTIPLEFIAPAIVAWSDGLDHLFKP
ncbi:TPA: hypothetical protein ACQVK3_005708 [Serratia marcescens]|uniref:Uncharacterized protein n=1 Tax=Serratia nevei TaxID=2703794 RepID=A0ABT7G6F9_9GAMM|nr:hypothetical protein [Serratia nevei]HAU4290853.1 hypothetical protein [Serratia marcescens]MDK5169023.1 hypothetical protein [Serratia nevei]MDK5298517.1 hypothetical protein [Serratia nevei]MEC5887231.1 hypothetical protein [Serratia nevei]HAU4297493.1 hypothetical protein [Serratia marcescens]